MTKPTLVAMRNATISYLSRQSRYDNYFCPSCGEWGLSAGPCDQCNTKMELAKDVLDEMLNEEEGEKCQICHGKGALDPLPAPDWSLGTITQECPMCYGLGYV